MQFGFLRRLWRISCALLAVKSFLSAKHRKRQTEPFFSIRGLAYENSVQELSSLTETATPPRIEGLQPVCGNIRLAMFLLPCAAESQTFCQRTVTAWHGLRRVSRKST